MELSILVAKILALVYISAGVGALRGTITFGKIVQDFEKSPALTYMTGFIALVMGALLVNYHNIWVKDWTVLITIVAWAALIKGVFLIAFPGYISAFKGWYKNTKAWGVFMLALGVLFGYLALYA